MVNTNTLSSALSHPQQPDIFQVLPAKQGFTLTEPHWLLISIHCFYLSISIQAHQNLKRFRSDRERETLAHLYSLSFKILAAAQRFPRASRVMSYQSWILLDIRCHIHVHDLNSLIEMQFSLLTVLIHTVIVINAVSHVRAFLNFSNQDTLPDAVYRSCRNKICIAFVNSDLCRCLSSVPVSTVFGGFPPLPHAESRI